jgi:hypothetical protein
MFVFKQALMAIIYHDPNTVTAPQKFIKAVHVLYDGKEDGFSLAMIDWEGTDHIGIRWNVAAKELNDGDKQAGKVRCEGSPSAKGIPSWFILPRELFNPVLFDKDSKRFMELVAGWRR